MKLRSMKLIFSFFLVFLISAQTLFANNIQQVYSIKTKGVTIGILNWNLNIAENKYKTSIKLKSKGLLSKLYGFSGDYSAIGTIQKNILYPSTYVQNWETSAQKKYVELRFKGNAIESLTLSPKEKEIARIKYKELENYKDPLSSLINILLNGKQSYTIDGRRAYLLFPDREGNKILIKEYINIWADHKKNDLEYLEVQLNEQNTLPEKIIIKFKGSLFYLRKI